MLDGILSAVGWVLSAWPYWVPVLLLFLGFNMGRAAEAMEVRNKLTRLARGIEIPTGWRGGPIVTELDGAACSREEMAQSSLVIRLPDGHGSAVCISSTGLVITNAHVVGDDDVIEIEHDDQSYLGVVLKRDSKRDVAVLLVGNQSFKPVKIATAPVRVGDDLFIAGTPNRIENRNLLTRGVVSKIGPFAGKNVIHTDAAIAPGNSGGPVFNEAGELVGLSVAIQLDQRGGLSHIGLVIPIDAALKALKIETGAPHGVPTESESVSGEPTAAI